VRIVHLSDVHVWRYDLRPWRLAGKRAVGMLELIRGRARRFRLERLAEVVHRAAQLKPDHVLITGDLTTTALDAEFADAKLALAELLVDSLNVSVVPGNHDRYTSRSVRKQSFERAFGAYAPFPVFPWLRLLDDRTAILGLDPTRSHLSAKGRLPADQLANARELVRAWDHPARRLIVACHYPLAAPDLYQFELAPKRMANAGAVADWLAGVGPHLYCCGHVHAAWAFSPTSLPNQLCLNAGAPLLRDPTGRRPPGFLVIDLDDDAVTVAHHAWSGSEWVVATLVEPRPLFAPASPIAAP